MCGNSQKAFSFTNLAARCFKSSLLTYQSTRFKQCSNCACRFPSTLINNIHSNHWNVRNIIAILTLIPNYIERHFIDPARSIDNQPHVAISSVSSKFNTGVCISWQYLQVFMETCSLGCCTFQIFLFKKMHLNKSSENWSFCLEINILTHP